MMRRGNQAWRGGLILLCLGAAVSAQTTPLTTRIVASGFTNPLYVTAPPGDTSRIFVVEQRGTPAATSARIMIVDLTTNPPTTLATPFLTVTGVSTNNEQGLLGMAFPPDYASTGRFYVCYMASTTKHVARGTVSANPNIANPGLTDILTITQSFSNHNGGWIGFGPDGFLYISTGDGGSEEDPSHIGQNKNTLLSKMLRIDVSGPTGYTIPPTNPWAAGGGVPEMWLWGLRNPWRNSFDRLTGDMYIGDVGQDTYEEVDFVPAGVSNLNFGWSCMEATHCCTTCAAGSGCTCSVNCPGGSGLTCPIAEYPRGTGQCVTGGYVYRGSKIPDWQGRYFFADYSSGQKFHMPAGGGPVTNITSMLVPTLGCTQPCSALTSITSFGEDASGEIYIVTRGGRIARIEVNCSGSALSISPQPANQTVCQGQNVVFTSGAVGTRGAMTFTWRKNGSPIGAPSMSTLTLNNVQAGDAGSYDVVVQDQCNSATSNAATLTVNTAPSISQQPSDQTVCEGGSATFTISAGGSPAPSYQWRKDGTNISGQTTSSLTINPVTQADAGSYDVVLTNSCGTSTSSRATLNVTARPLGDLDANCTVDEVDESIFVDVLLEIDTDPDHVARADINGDTFVDGLDIDPFTHLLAP